jgi:diadenosine tetraphosphate (Ap4A) HIT family hydrolase
VDRERRVSAFSIGDAFPVSPGHSLVITKRRITISWGKQAERRDVLDLVLEQAFVRTGWPVLLV